MAYNEPTHLLNFMGNKRWGENKQTLEQAHTHINRTQTHTHSLAKQQKKQQQQQQQPPPTQCMWQNNGTLSISKGFSIERRQERGERDECVVEV